MTFQLRRRFPLTIVKFINLYFSIEAARCEFVAIRCKFYFSKIFSTKFSGNLFYLIVRDSFSDVMTWLSFPHIFAHLSPPDEDKSCPLGLQSTDQHLSVCAAKFSVIFKFTSILNKQRGKLRSLEVIRGH